MSSNQYTTIFSPTACDEAADVLAMVTRLTTDGTLSYEYNPLGCYFKYGNSKLNNHGNSGYCSDEDSVFVAR